jgi:lipid-A-disaccharide synthase-like uncharacterized protein
LTIAILPPVSSEFFWLSVGFVGQAMFFMRFLLQWLASEKSGQSIIPPSFWYFSILGALALLAYSVYRADPVFIIGQLLGLIIYSRNLHLLHKMADQVKRQQHQETHNAPPHGQPT